MDTKEAFGPITYPYADSEHQENDSRVPDRWHCRNKEVNRDGDQGPGSTWRVGDGSRPKAGGDKIDRISPEPGWQRVSAQATLHR